MAKKAVCFPIDAFLFLVFFFHHGLVVYLVYVI